MTSQLFKTHPEDAAIDAARASLPPLSNATAQPDQLLTWLTNYAQQYARAVDADHRENALHFRDLMDRAGEELLFRITRANSGRSGL